MECGIHIFDEYSLGFEGSSWHKDCIKCCLCLKPLTESTKCFMKDNRLYCREDYIKYDCRLDNEFESVRINHFTPFLQYFFQKMCKMFPSNHIDGLGSSSQKPHLPSSMFFVWLMWSTTFNWWRFRIDGRTDSMPRTLFRNSWSRDRI